jgi:hypothetical protein
MLTLVRISTGEDWQNLMYACYPCWIGSGFAVVYFVSFVFFAMFILLVRTLAYRIAPYAKIAQRFYTAV